MEVKTGYKQTEVGVIPEDWDLVLVSKFGETKRGAGSLCIKYRQSGGVRLIRINDFFEDKPVYVEPTAEIMRFALTERDLLFAGTGASAGASYIPKEEWRGLPHSYNAPRIRVFKEHCKEFLLYALQSGYVLRQQRAGFVGNAQPFLDIKAISNFSIACPATSTEQRAIAAALSDVDALLGGLDRLIAKKRDLKQAAMQQLLTGQSRLPGFSGEWAKTKISEMCEYVDGVRTAGGDVGYVEIGDIDVERKSYSLSQKEKLSVPGAVKVPAGTLLISTVRPTRGAIAVTQSSLYVSSAFCRLRPASGLLFHLVCQPTFLAYLGENSIGGTYPTCRDETILDYETVFPCDPREQSAIAAVLSDMDAELTALEARRDKTRALKQAMMQELLTGRTRLVPAGAAHA